MKTLLLTLTACLTLMFPLFSSAATLTSANVSGACGVQDVTVDISIDSAAGVDSIQFELFFDPLKIDALSANATTLTAGWTVVANPNLLDRITVAAAGPVIASGAGPVFQIHFKVLTTATNNSTSVLDLQKASINEGAIAALMTDGVFTVTCAGQGVSGDANGDNSVSVADVFYLISNLFTAGPAPVGTGGDPNGDGQVSVADVFYLISFLFTGGPAPR